MKEVLRVLGELFKMTTQQTKPPVSNKNDSEKKHIRKPFAVNEGANDRLLTLISAKRFESLAKFSSAVGISQSYFSEILHGSYPARKTRLKICMVLDCDERVIWR